MTVIRTATEADVPDIRRAIRSAIVGIAFRDYPAEILENWGIDSPEMIAKQRSAILESRELTWVAVAADTIVGFSALDPQHGVVRAVYVAADAARGGVGSSLLLEVEARARMLGLPRLTLDSSLTAEPFYQRHGYSSLVERMHTLASGLQMRAVRMEKAL